MNWKRIAALLLLATALQFLLGGSRFRSIWPIDVFLIATAIVARGGNSVTAVLVGGTMGLLEDALTSDLLGMNAFAKAAIGYVLALLSLRVMFGGVWAVGAAPRRRVAGQRCDRGGARFAAAAGADRSPLPGEPLARRGDGRDGRASRSGTAFRLERLVGEEAPEEAAVKEPRC